MLNERSDYSSSSSLPAARKKEHKLGQARLAELLPQVPGWELSNNGHALTRTFQFDNYYRTLAFVNALAFIAHCEDHHPDMNVHYGRAVVCFSTHKIGESARLTSFAPLRLPPYTNKESDIAMKLLHFAALVALLLALDACNKRVDQTPVTPPTELLAVRTPKVSGATSLRRYRRTHSIESQSRSARKTHRSKLGTKQQPGSTGYSGEGSCTRLGIQASDAQWSTDRTDNPSTSHVQPAHSQT